MSTAVKKLEKGLTMEPFEYLDRVLSRGKASNDADIAALVESPRSTISVWRSGRSTPNWENLEKLARLAGIDQRQALVDFAVWASKGAAKKVGETVLRSLPMLTLALFLVLGTQIEQSRASSQAVNSVHIHYATIRRLYRRMKALWRNAFLNPSGLYSPFVHALN